jgi:hypothetical protein
VPVKTRSRSLRRTHQTENAGVDFPSDLLPNFLPELLPNFSETADGPRLPALEEVLQRFAYSLASDWPISANFFNREHTFKKFILSTLDITANLFHDALHSTGLFPKAQTS